MLFSCSRDKTPRDTSVTITNRFSHIVVETEVQSVRSLFLSDSGLYVLGSAQIDGEYCQVVSKLDPSGESSLTRLDLPENISINDCCMDGTGNLLIESTTFDPETFTQKCYVYCFTEGIEKWSKALDDYADAVEFASPYMTNLDSIWYIAYSDRLLQFDADGNVLRNDALPGNAVGIFVSREKVHVLGRDYHIIADESEAEQSETWLKALNDKNVYNGAITSGGGYDYIYNTDSALLGCTIGGEDEIIVDWLNSDLIGGYANSVLIYSQDVVYVNYNDFYSGESGLYRLERMPDYELPESQVIKIDYCEDGSRQIPTAAKKFNESHTDVRVICNELGTDSADRLNAALASGTAGDIIELQHDIEDENYISKGVFLDLYSLGDAAIKPDEIFGCVRQAYESDGRLFVIPYTFSIGTITVKKGTISADEWTVDRFIGEYEKAREKGIHLIDDMGRDGILNALGGALWNRYIDYENSKCDFDSESFRDTLEWLRSLPESDAIDKYSGDHFGDGTLIADVCGIFNISSYVQTLARWGAADSGEIIGYPYENGGTAKITSETRYGINSASKNPEGAMMFLREILSGDEKIGIRGMGMGIPSLKSLMLTAAEAEAGNTYKYDTSQPGSIRGGSQDVPEEERLPGWVYVKVDDELVEKFSVFVDVLKVKKNVSPKITEIIDNELSGFFGGRTAEDTARNIQSRVSLYLAERQ